ncbi:MAG: hypothetical protein FGM14_08045 [Flavobacteriales bacterium]|nr:hypothetical protein [Flavobacteriales bacterium]
MKIVSVYFSLLFVLFGVSSCIEHEVIPPPTNTLDLNASFVGYVNGTQVEFTQNVLNYKGYSDKYMAIYASPLLSKMLFISEMKSFTDQRAIRLTFGSLDWDASANSTPTLTMFNDFHTSTSGIDLPFRDWATLIDVANTTDGIQIEYTDQNGLVWISRESDPGQIAKFTVLDQATDKTGDYSLFEVTFSCKVWRYNVQTELDESLNISNGKLKAWFKL